MSTLRSSASGTTDASGASRKHQSHMPAAPVFTCGWLRLKGGFFRSWKAYYFVLTKGELLAFATARFEGQPHKHRIQVAVVEKSAKHEMGFVVASPTGTQLTVAATCERDFDKWTMAFTGVAGPKTPKVVPQRVFESPPPTPSMEPEVYLYVPTNVIPLTTSATALDAARAEITKLQATLGDHVPMRSTLDDPSVEWRVGKPDYTLVNLLFLQGKTYNHKPGSLEWMVQNLIKTWEMEVCHKTNAQQMTTMHPKLFQCTVNGASPVAADDLVRNGKYDTFLAAAPTAKALYDAKRSTRDRASMTFGSAFPDGFAWEVLEVFSKLPRVSFSWRHWGYPKQSSTKSPMVELFGFTILDLDASNRICGMETFYKADAFLDALHRQKLLKRPEETSARQRLSSSMTGRSTMLDGRQSLSSHSKASAASHEDLFSCPFDMTSPAFSERQSTLSAPSPVSSSSSKCPFAGKFL
ncbi:hypothetical protein SDRG_01871 [Saprolegnia diclina VS20]|uniref:PH domain-containing protein n=1 Tax=Saprolegnia diclina (strain VS20) TaxID=1156394 RepID=T0SD18_SAPDV|nr:hypothetical protein SDRG_01871 [Saprolegnia diclina VS20]EQC40802.1 hypothetical protein SDRG_01871 [Saprolegnia diclina VS20]|eukprot:XP_008605646.1 hypothetical protein SDRG_01871 [Saprolegnia diclina VS20]